MFFWKKKKKQEEKLQTVQNPYITFELVDGVHLQISIAWPPNSDIKPFAELLALLNSGNLVGPQLVESVLYANQVNQPEKAMVIHAALDSITSSIKKDNQPLVPPSKAMAHIINYHVH